MNTAIAIALIITGGIVLIALTVIAVIVWGIKRGDGNG